METGALTFWKLILLIENTLEKLEGLARKFRQNGGDERYTL